MAWALHRHPERFDFRLFDAQDRFGGNAITVDMPQDDGTSIPFDISVTACIPSVYHHILLFMEQHGIDLVDTRFSYSVRYRGGIYAHDFDSDIGRALRPEIVKFQKLQRRLKWFGRLNRTRSKLLNALNPFNYVSMGTVLNFSRFSGDFRYKVLKPMFVNFLMATNVFDMPASLFARYLEFFDIERATPMRTWGAVRGASTRKCRRASGTKSTSGVGCGRCTGVHRRSSWRTRKATPRPSTMSSSPATRTRH